MDIDVLKEKLEDNIFEANYWGECNFVSIGRYSSSIDLVVYHPKTQTLSVAYKSQKLVYIYKIEVHELLRFIDAVVRYASWGKAVSILKSLPFFKSKILDFDLKDDDGIDEIGLPRDVRDYGLNENGIPIDVDLFVKRLATPVAAEINWSQVSLIDPLKAGTYSF